MLCPYFSFSRVPLSPSVSVSSASAHARFVAAGTTTGAVVLLDYAGTERRRWSAHSARVSCVCIDDAGEFIASASEDGTVVVRSTGLSGDDVAGEGWAASLVDGGEDRVSFTHHRPVLALALAADYASPSSSRAIVAGGDGGRLRLARRTTLLGASTETVLKEGAGPVRAIALSPMLKLLAWADDEGVKMIAPLSDRPKEPIGFYETPAFAPPREAAPPRLLWEEGTDAVAAAEAVALLHISWGNTIRTVAVREREREATTPQIGSAISSSGPTPLVGAAATPFFGAAMTPILSSSGGGGTRERSEMSTVPLPPPAAAPTRGLGLGSLRTAISSSVLGDFARAMKGGAEAAASVVGNVMVDAAASAATVAAAVAGASVEPGAGAALVGVIAPDATPPRSRFSKTVARLEFPEADAIVCGVVPLGDMHLAALILRSAAAPSSEGTVAPTVVVELCILSRAGLGAARILVRIAVPLNGVSLDLLPSEVHLLSDGVAREDADGLSNLVIVVPRDIVISSPFTAVERSTWLLAQGRARESLAVLTSGTVPRSILEDTIDAYVDSLSSSRAVVEAVRFFPHLAATRRSASWSRLGHRIFKAGDKDGPRALLALLPLPPGPPREWVPPPSTAAAFTAAVQGAAAFTVPGDPPLNVRRSGVALDPSAFDAAIAFFIASDDVADSEALLAALRCWWVPPSSDGHSFDAAPSMLPDVREAHSYAEKQAQALGDPTAMFKRVVSLARTVIDDVIKAPEASLGRPADSDGALNSSIASQEVDGQGESMFDGGGVIDEQPLDSGERVLWSTSRAPLFSVDAARHLLSVRLAPLLSQPLSSPPAPILAPLLDSLVETHLLAGDVRAAVDAYLANGAVLARCDSEFGCRADVARTPTGPAAAFAILDRFSSWELVSTRVRDLVTLSRTKGLEAVARRLPGTGVLQRSRGGGLFPLEAVLSQLDEGGGNADADVCDYLLTLSVLRHAAFETAGGELASAHARLLRLLPVHRPDALLEYLQRSAAYPFDAARDLCLRGGAPLGAPPREPPLWRELAFVLVRSGNAREALDVMLGKLGDVCAAVALTMRADAGDGFLYRDLLAASVRAALAAPTPEAGGELLGKLLDELSETPYSIVRVLQDYPTTLPIPRLRERLRHLLQTVEKKRKRHEVTVRMLSMDVMALVTRRFRTRGRAMRVGNPGVLSCSLCAGSATMPRAAKVDVVADDGGADEESSGVVASAPEQPNIHIFFCGHMYHNSCLQVYVTGNSLAAASSGGRASRSSSVTSLSRSSSSNNLSGALRSSGGAPPRAPAASRAVSAPNFSPSRGARRSFGGSFSEDFTGRAARSSVIDADIAHSGIDDVIMASMAADAAAGGAVFAKEHVAAAANSRTLRCPLCERTAAVAAAGERGASGAALPRGGGR